jgi:hypothetical protein
LRRGTARTPLALPILWERNFAALALSSARILFPLGTLETGCWEKKISMDNTTIIQIVAGVLFVVILIVLIQRRRTRVK